MPQRLPKIQNTSATVDKRIKTLDIFHIQVLGQEGKSACSRGIFPELYIVRPMITYYSKLDMIITQAFSNLQKFRLTNGIMSEIM